jgi:hypothetical protein
VEKEKIDRSKMGFIVYKGLKEIKCKTEEEVWKIIEGDWVPYHVTYEDGYWAKQFIPF